MSLSATLNNALSGLNASSRGAQVVSSNISNALTEGYGRRVLQTSAEVTGTNGAGVRVNGVLRESNAVLIGDRRLAEAETGKAQTRADALSRLEAAIGTPDGEDSIAGRIGALEAALVTAASRPDSTIRLADVLATAQGVTSSIRAAADDIQSVRMEAEADIVTTVDDLNDSLRRVAEINVEIRSQHGTTNDVSALYDQRQILVDRIAEIVPLREIPRENGMIALYTEKGAALVDGLPSEFGFSPTPFIAADSTLESGALSPLTLNGLPVSVTGGYAPMAGGRLGALFEQRDVLAPAAQADLDALARDMIERFSDPALGASVDAAGLGLFTNAGAAFDPSDPANEIGLSDRIAVNDVVNPDAGGALWRLRNGLGAAAEGLAGESAVLNGFSEVLSAGRIQLSGSYAGHALNATGVAAETVSRISVQAQRAIENEGYASARYNALKEAELAEGVDTDAELQNLMLFEQAYAANAKVMQTVDQMMQLLMEM